MDYKGHWKWWALKLKTFLGPEMATSDERVIWAQKSPNHFHDQCSSSISAPTHRLNMEVDLQSLFGLHVT
jgi:hypothetical protein